MFRAAVFHVKHCRFFAGRGVHGICGDITPKASCRNREKRGGLFVRLIQLSAVGEVFLEGE